MDTGRFSVHHVGVLVADLDSALEFATGRLGCELTKRVELSEERTEIAFVRCGDLTVELIEIADEQLRARRARVPGAKAEIEHLALAVDDLDAVVAELEASGMTFTAGAGRVETTTDPREVAGTRSLFTSRRTSAGILFQLIEDLPTAPR
jgi:catechol 2,3-dioxygenase-like lactoylglutathione lyase family enzyme